jgi:glyoxylase-like metal-dependent hydrolase (beta-lactamase superfamily II)
MITEITSSITKISNDSNIYYLKDLNLVIDAGNNALREQTVADINQVCDPKSVKVVIFTHLHYDHIGCYDLFENAKFFASKKEIKSLHKDREGTILNEELSEKFNIDIEPIDNLSLPSKFIIIDTPGHTCGGICIYDRDEKILFSGDTIFNNGYGRCDLPNSNEQDLITSLKLLQSIEIKILCPGHDY